MKAIVQDAYGPTDLLELRDIDRPVPRDDEVLVEVRAAGVDPSVWHLMTGRPYVARAVLGLRSPKNPVRGWDGAGRVAAVGAKVTDFQPGDEVFGNCEGSFAEYARAKATRLALKPPNLSFEQAAALPVSGMTALQALSGKARPRPGQKVLVVGASGVSVHSPSSSPRCTVPRSPASADPRAGTSSAPRAPPTSSTTPARTSQPAPTATTSSSTTPASAPCPSSAGHSRRAARSSSSAARAGAPSSAV